MFSPKQCHHYYHSPKVARCKLSSSNHNTSNWYWEEELTLLLLSLLLLFCDFGISDSSTKSCMIRCIFVNVEKILFFPDFDNVLSNEYNHSWWILSFEVVSLWIRSCAGLFSKCIKFVCNSLRFGSLDNVFLFSEVETITF